MCSIDPKHVIQLRKICIRASTAEQLQTKRSNLSCDFQKSKFFKIISKIFLFFILMIFGAYLSLITVAKLVVFVLNTRAGNIQIYIKIYIIKYMYSRVTDQMVRN